jgi:predicted ATP-grasp superfamily ATP-dependent carboligase
VCSCFGEFSIELYVGRDSQAGVNQIVSLAGCVIFDHVGARPVVINKMVVAQEFWKGYPKGMSLIHHGARILTISDCHHQNQVYGQLASCPYDVFWEER